MSQIPADVAILGSGFGGSLTALLVNRAGLRPVLIDRGSHPRFAIGESSTPIADFVLRDLARAYNLPRLEPLAKYGTWQKTYPQLVCGLKRGFSYFHQQANRLFEPRSDHDNELLVAASSDDAHADTHWLRADVDAFLAEEVQRAGIPFFDRTEVSLVPNTSDWRLSGTRQGDDVDIHARFVVDATGEAGVVPRVLNIPTDPAALTTDSFAIFGHFRNVQPWHDRLVLSGAAVQDHPFYCDHAALHHVLEEGWMWQLRFNNGITSVGFVLDGRTHPLDGRTSAAQQWNQLLRRYPSIAAQLDKAQLVQPPGGLRRSGRLQRCAAKMTGTNWALLPNTAGFIDPLHSSGIAQTLCGIERLVRILIEHWGKPSLEAELQHYEATLRHELLLIDKLVSGCYRARRNFGLFAAFVLPYFAGATTYEQRRHRQALPHRAGFLCAEDPDFRQRIEQLWQRLQRENLETIRPSQVSAFEREVAETIRPYNHVGLGDPSARNMYRYTAAPEW